jgi:hypothetical protein
MARRAAHRRLVYGMTAITPEVARNARSGVLMHALKAVDARTENRRRLHEFAT